MLENAIKSRNAAADPLSIDLFEAVQVGDSAGLQRAAEGGADVNVANSDGRTLFYLPHIPAFNRGSTCLIPQPAAEAHVNEGGHLVVGFQRIQQSKCERTGTTCDRTRGELTS